MIMSMVEICQTKMLKAMKKLVSATFLSFLMVCAGCQIVEIESFDDAAPAGGMEVTVTATIDGAAQTRVTLTPDQNGEGKPIVKVDWKESGEHFYVSASGQNEMFTQVSGNQFSGTLPESRWNRWSAYYGYNEDSSYDLSEQDGTLNEDYILMSSSYRGEPAELRFDFGHETAILKPTFKIEDRAVNADVDKIQILNVIDVSSSVYNGTITVTPEEDDIYIFLPCFPEISSGHTFIFDVLCGETSYYAQLTIPESMSIEAGKLYTATIRMSEHPADMCKLPPGWMMNSNIYDFMDANSGLTSIKFVSGSNETGTPVAGTFGVKAYMVADGTVLEIHTEAEKFTFNEDCSDMFCLLSDITSIDFGEDYIDTQYVTSMAAMFWYSGKLESVIGLTQFDTRNVTNMSNMFNGCSLLVPDLTGFNTDNVEDMGAMLAGCDAVTSFDLRHFKTSKVKQMSNMFSGCDNLASLDLSSFNTENVESMYNMFHGCKALTSLDLTSFNTQNVKEMADMFSDCSKLKSLDLRNFNTANVTSMSDMFDGCVALTSLDVSSFVTSNVTDMSSMFAYCRRLSELDIRNFTINSETNVWGFINGIGYYSGSSENIPIYVTSDVYNILNNNTDVGMSDPDTRAEYVIVDALSVSDAAGLKNAVTESESGDVIILTDDITLTETINITHSLTINLGGFDLDASSNQSRPFWLTNGSLIINAEGSEISVGKYGLIDVKEGDATIVLNKGTYSGNTDNGAFIKVRGNGKVTLTMNDVNYTDASDDGYVTNVQSRPDYGKSVITQINGGEYSAAAGFQTLYDDSYIKNATITGRSNDQLFGAVEVNGDAIIENSTITSAGYAVAVSSGATLTVTDCIVNSDLYAYVVYPTGGFINVTGGSYTGDLYIYDFGSNAVSDSAIVIDEVTVASKTRQGM